MLFNTAIFAAFFVVFVFVYRVLATRTSTRMWLIVAGSATFYAAWDYRFVPLLFGTALVDFFVARKIEDAGEDTSRRKKLLVVSIVLNLGVLAIFKYTDFALRTLYGVAGLFASVGPAPVTGIVLPAGISFYTFQSMSYTVDVYRRELEARRHPRDFLAAVSFFPHLVAGPIIRASTLLPQFERVDELSWSKTRTGFMFVAAGLFNKTVADLLAPAADALFNTSGPHSLLETWTGVLAFTGQIYGDFAGYTEIAIGVALLLGFVLPMNFAFPYVASSPADFWRRWHISLSSWLRDYLYISLGGNRHHHLRNLMLTMLLGGLWHGASWTFVAWGGYHGLLLVLTAAVASLLGKRIPKPLGRAFGTLLTFYFTLIGWVLFRSSSFGGAVEVIRNMHHSTIASTLNHDTRLAFLLVVGALPLGHAVSLWPRLPFFSGRGAILAWPIIVLLVVASIVFGGSGNAFIYFQF